MTTLDHGNKDRRLDSLKFRRLGGQFSKSTVGEDYKDRRLQVQHITRGIDSGGANHYLHCHETGVLTCPASFTAENLGEAGKVLSLAMGLIVLIVQCIQNGKI